MGTQVFQLIPASAIRRDRQVRETTTRILDRENLRRKISLIIDSGQDDRKKIDNLHAQLAEEVITKGGGEQTVTSPQPLVPVVPRNTMPQTMVGGDSWGGNIDASAAAAAAAAVTTTPLGEALSDRRQQQQQQQQQPDLPGLQDRNDVIDDHDDSDVADTSYPQTVPLRNGMTVDLQNGAGVRTWIHMG